MVEEPMVGTDEDWETITGLIDDVNAYMLNCRFGPPLRDEYQAAIVGEGQQAIHFLTDFVSDDGTPLGSQGYSVGGGWIVSDDGGEISHPARAKIVKSSVYGQLIDDVVLSLQVPMKQYGTPLVARSWEGLGFHWRQKVHKTVKEGETRTAPMPVEFLGRIDPSDLRKKAKGGQPVAARAAAAARPSPKAAPAAGKAGAMTPALESKLAALARNMEFSRFQDAALKIPEVAGSDDLLATVLDDSTDGFWSSHRQ